jgi:tetratricopeptide (TPR) repeat protein
MKRLVINVFFLLAPLPQVNAALLPESEGYRLFSEGNYAKAAHVWCEALAKQETRPETDTPTLAATLFNLAAAERMQSHLAEAADLYTRSIAVRERLSGPGSPDLGHSLAGLALVYQADGRLDDALTLARRAVHVSAADPDNWRQYDDIRNTLGTILMLHGDTAEAAALSADTASELELAGRTSTHEYITAMTNLGTANLRSGKLREAETDLRRAEASSLLVAGPKHRLTATIWNNLGKIRAAQGDLNAAEQLFLKAIEVWRNTLGPSHPDVASGLSNLAGVYQSRKRYPEAERLYRQVIEIDTSAMGPQSVRVANDWNNLGALFAAQHRYALAATYFEKALALAGQHPDAQAIARNLSTVREAVVVQVAQR